MTDTPTIEQRALQAVVALIGHAPATFADSKLVQAFIAAITEAEAIGEARGLGRLSEPSEAVIQAGRAARHTSGNSTTEVTMGIWRAMVDAIRKEAAERAGGRAHE